MFLRIISNIGNKYKQIYETASEVAGLALQYVSKHGENDESDFENEVLTLVCCF